MIDSDTLKAEIARNVAAALAEDIGTGDLTAKLIDPEKEARGRLISREPAILCGQAWFEAAFRFLEPEAMILWFVREGERIEPNQPVCEIESRARTLLTAERTALNFLQLLSGVATQVHRYCRAVEGTAAKIVDTRKTIPGLRLAQKYAVQVGGGTNHRIGLYDGILIKENHIIAAGGIRQALEAAQRIAPSNVFVQIEVETLAQLREALACGAKMILLDNMSLEDMAEAVRITQDRAELEASGGVDLERVRQIAAIGVHRISIGRLTKDIRAIDFSLRHVEI
ncbi:carboxylating nicotinate-nucleotide diphosphorylase [Hydrogenophilus thiooxidans]|uniref:Probable nicotinate-nucleotide pyrophosphorylase [carboxylating] n=1 Tax=uncultured beta proteobacterium TaxID=86027 RepID=H5S9S8_9PROT|nr:carboxylating nicotinate-nucleotide diphosphorylase [Hydrogenophilus thiooxidans]BAL52914.1 nicotinate-nucleotide diphosphorylase (carboxylating) [uncultured beta proteobacterium]